MFSDDVRVNKQEIRDILDQMRRTIPGEIEEARWIAQERHDILAEAKARGRPDRRGSARTPDPARLPT